MRWDGGRVGLATFRDASEAPERKMQQICEFHFNHDVSEPDARMRRSITMAQVQSGVEWSAALALTPKRLFDSALHGTKGTSRAHAVQKL